MTAPLTPEERTGMCWREMQEVMPLLLSKQDMREMNIIEKHIAAAVADALKDEREKFKQMLYASDEELADRLIDLMTDKQEPTQ